MCSCSLHFGLHDPNTPVPLPSQALMQDMAQDDVQNISAFLPPCHEDADRPEHVYKFEDSIFSVSQWFLMPLSLDEAIWHVGVSRAFAPHKARAGSKVMLP